MPDGCAALDPGNGMSMRMAAVAAILLAGGVMCGRARDAEQMKPAGAAAGVEAFVLERQEMVRVQIEARGITDHAVLRAMREVPRHAFVPESLRRHAYQDNPLPIGEEQTISQPYIVALMTELARLEPGDRVLEIGTGSGYQAAVLEQVGAEVFTIEIISGLAQRARATLEALGSRHIHFREGDGYRGWPEQAPFDAILVTAAPPEVPRPLVEQLGMGGRLVIPVGDVLQSLVVITRTVDGLRREEITPVRFVPMTGEAQRGGS